MAWTTPHDWVPGEPISAVKLNEVAEQLRSLYNRPSAMVTWRGAESNLTTASTTIATVDPSMALQIPCTGAAIELALDFTGSHTIGNGLFVFDVLYNGVFASTGTASEISGGLWGAKGVTAAQAYGYSFRHVIPAGSVPANTVQTFALQWRVSTAGTATLFRTNFSGQFRVREI